LAAGHVEGFLLSKKEDIHMACPTAYGLSDNAVIAWLKNVQQHAAASDDIAVIRSLSFASEVMNSILLAFIKERERGADVIDASSHVPVALAHSLVAIASTLKTNMSLLETARVLASETFSSAEQLAAIIEEQVISASTDE
jgi:hypothetical protein